METRCCIFYLVGLSVREVGAEGPAWLNLFVFQACTADLKKPASMSGNNHCAYVSFHS